MAIAEGDDLIAFDFLVPTKTKAEVIAALFRCRRSTVAVNDRRLDGRARIPSLPAGSNGRPAFQRCILDPAR
jgi:hypothetical protein